MKLGICTSIDDIATVERMGFDYLEASASKIAAMPEEDFTRTLALAEGASIPCDCFNVLFSKAMRLIGMDRNDEALEDYLRTTFARLRQLHGRLVVFGSGKARSRPEDMSFSAAYRELVRVTRLMGKIAGEYGLAIVIEPLNRSETNLICSVAEGAMLAADVDLENVRLLADAYHMQVENESIQNIGRVGSLAHVHIAARQGRGYPLSEEEPFVALFEQLAGIGYDGGISIEGKTADFAREAPAALAVLRRLSTSV